MIQGGHEFGSTAGVQGIVEKQEDKAVIRLKGKVFWLPCAAV